MDHPFSAHSPRQKASWPPRAAASLAQQTVTARRQVDSGQAIKLRAAQPSVMRVVHGRVWLTLTAEANPVSASSRALAGDYFLAAGDSLRLLAGQEVVVEAFGIGHAAPASFSWEGVGHAAQARLAATTALFDWQTGVLQPLHDMQRATALMLGAAGRLLHGLARGAATTVKVPLAAFAILFVASNDRRTGATTVFDLKNQKNAAFRAVQPASNNRPAEPSKPDGLACGRTQGCSA